MSNKYNSDTLFFKISHEIEKHINFFVVQRRCRFIQNKNLTFHINRTCNRNHLLNCKRTASELLSRSGGNTEFFQYFIGTFFIILMSDQCRFFTAYKHILRNRKVRAESNLLINRTDTFILGILRRMDRNVFSVNGNLTAIHSVNTRKYLNKC